MRRKNSGKRERGWKFLIAVQTTNFKTRVALKKKKKDLTHMAFPLSFIFLITQILEKLTPLQIKML